MPIAVFDEAGSKMPSRTVRLDASAARALARIRRLTGLSSSEVLKRGLAAYKQIAPRKPVTPPYEAYARLDLGRGGWAVARSRDAKRGVRDTVRRKQAR